MLSEENVAHDINGYAKAPPSFRVWAGGTIEPNNIDETIPTSDRKPMYLINNADNKIVAIVKPDTGLFDEPTIPAIYAAIDEKINAIMMINTVMILDTELSIKISL